MLANIFWGCHAVITGHRTASQSVEVNSAENARRGFCNDYESVGRFARMVQPPSCRGGRHRSLRDDEAAECGLKPRNRAGQPHRRVKAGDRLVSVTASDSGPVKEILDFSRCALVLGENSAMSWDGVASFGAPDGAELTPAVALAMRIGFRAAVSLGLPREYSEDWKFGA